MAQVERGMPRFQVPAFCRALSASTGNLNADDLGLDPRFRRTTAFAKFYPIVKQPSTLRHLDGMNNLKNHS